MKIKLIVPALCAATLAACGGDDNKSNNAQIEDNNAQNEAPVVTPVEEESSALDDLNIECVEVAKSFPDT